MQIQSPLTPIRADEKALMTLVDTMAQAATIFAGQGYEQFLYAREEVAKTVHEVCTRRNCSKMNKSCPLEIT